MRFAAAVAALLLSAALAAQVRENVVVSLIEVPVTVIDNHGNPVRGLTRSNFEVYDQGRKQSVSAFEVIDFKAPQATTAITPLNPAARRSFLLLFDLAFSGPNSLARAQEAARRFVRENLQPRDLAGVAVIEADRGCRLLSSFTTDRELIASAIDDPRSFRRNDPLGLSNQTRMFIPELEPLGMDKMDTSNVDSSKGHGAEAALHELDMAKNAQWLNEQTERLRVERHVDALRQLALILDNVPGRKQVILLSDGMPAKGLLGRDVHDSKEEREQTERIIDGTWNTSKARQGDLDQDQRFGNSAAQTLLEAMAQRFNRSDVLLHAVDLKGARLQTDTYEGKIVSSNRGLAALARSTGGDIFENSNQLGDDFARLLHQQEVVYILGFQVSSADNGKYHDLKVKVNGAGRVRVNHRAGYVSGKSTGERALNDAEIIINDIPQPDVRVAALATPIPSAAERDAVPLVLDFNGQDLLQDVAASDAEAQLFVYAFDESGIVRDRLVDRLILHVGAAGDALRRDNLRYFATLALPPGKYAIKALVRVPQTGRRGYVRTDVEVPRAGEVAVLPPLSVAPSATMLVRGPSHAGDAAFPFHVNGSPFMPAPRPTAQKGVPSRFALFVFNAAAADLQIEGTVTDAQGHTRPFTPDVVARLQGEQVTKILFDYAGGDAARLDLVVHGGQLAAGKRVGIAVDMP